jgi:hypothetical protein
MENILPWGRQRRLIAGLILAAAAIALAVTLVLLVAGPWWFTGVFVLAWLAALLLLEARERT